MMLRSKSSVLHAVFIVFFVLQPSALAVKKSYIVYLGSHSHGPQISSADLLRVKRAHHGFLGSFLGSKKEAKDAIFYSYDRHINGFAANLEEDTAAEIAKHPDVLSVFLNKPKRLHTTHSWEFLGQENKGTINHGSLWEKANLGEDIIIASLDTGVWPESKSFSDEGFGPIPSKWKGSCENDFPCNKKLIGARSFSRGFVSAGGKLNPELDNPRDNQGHGTHAISVAGGNFVPGINVFGMGNGTAKGGAPRARVASYKVCWFGRLACHGADILKAFDMAIHDGADVLSLSIGDTPADYFQDPVAIGSFHAVKQGVVVVGSAGNSGPGGGSVTNVAPWIITVGASTTDRQFQSSIHLGNGQTIMGEGLSKPMPSGKSYPLITGFAAQADTADPEYSSECSNGTLDPEKVKGKIVVCSRDEVDFEIGLVATQAGAVGLVICNDISHWNDYIVDPTDLPTIILNTKDCGTLQDYIAANFLKDPEGLITGPQTVLNAKPTPYVLGFSAPGPNSVTFEVLKPDVVAPGINIISAYSEATVDAEFVEINRPRVPFRTFSGTSVSSPHVAAVAALLKSIHPDWSPAAIRSAIMTTATVRDNTGQPIQDTFSMSARAFAMGAGQIQPERAKDPGLIFDLKINDYLDFLCPRKYNQSMFKIFSEGPHECPNDYSLLNFNNPAITTSDPSALPPVMTFTRRLKNVGAPGTYTAHVVQQPGMFITVEPNALTFNKYGEEKSFRTTIKPTPETAGFVNGIPAEIAWTDGYHNVRITIATLYVDSSED